MKIKIVTKRHLTLVAAATYSQHPHPDYLERVDVERQKIDRDKVAALFDEVNGRATRHTVAVFEVFGLVQDAVARLDRAGVTKANQTGAVLTYHPASPTANRYKYKIRTTQVELTRGSTGDWFLTGIERVELWPKTPERNTLTISPAAQADVTRNAMTGFAVAA
jgi:hypothetical protein